MQPWRAGPIRDTHGGMIHSAILVAALLATATDEEVNIAAWIEADSLSVGQEYELFLELELGPGRNSGSAACTNE